MDIQDIELVRTIIETGSLSESSDRLHKSQPTLSRKLSRLEQRLGATLFHRSPRGLVATEVAHFIVDNAAPIDQHLNKIRRHVERMTALEAGSLQIGVGPIVEQTLLPDLLSGLWRESGDVQLTVVTGEDHTLARMLEMSEVDVIIGPFPPGDWEGRGFIARPMITERFVTAARVGHPVLTADRLSADDLLPYPLAAPKTGTSATAPLAPLQKPPKLRVDNYNLLKKITMETDAICVGPPTIFADEVEAGLLQILDLDFDAWWRSTLIVRPEALESPLVHRLVSLGEEVVGKQQPRTGVRA